MSCENAAARTNRRTLHICALKACALPVTKEDSTNEATLAAMRSGVDVIYQATLEHGVWSGRVDFLRKVDAPSALGDWSYEPFDTKLARETKAGTILQLCVYAHLLEEDPGDTPEL